MRGKKSNYVKAKDRTNLSAGDVIRVACDMLGINQAELARRSDIAESHISAIIAGKRTVGKVVAKKLGDALKISAGNILFAGEKPREGSHIVAIEKRVKTLRAQQNEIKSLVKGSLKLANKLEGSEGKVRNLMLNLKRISEINEEEDITGIYVLAKKAMEDSKSRHKG